MPISSLFFDGIYVKKKETNKLLISVPPIFRYFNQSQQYVWVIVLEANAQTLIDEKTGMFERYD